MRKLSAASFLILALLPSARAEEPSELSVSLERQCLALGKGHAAQVERYPDQTLKSVVCLLNGEPDGPATEFFPSAAKASEGENIAGKPAGLWDYFYVDGKRKEEGIYWFGERVCTWKSWDASGALKTREEKKPKGRSCDSPWPSDFRSVAESERATEEPASAPLTSVGVRQRFQLLNFQGTLQAWTQTSRGAALTGGIGWAPTFRLIDHQLELAGQIGLGLNRAFGGTLFVLSDYQLFASYIRFMPYFFRVGTGAQTWYTGGTGWMATAQVERALPLWFVNSVFLSYSVVTFPSGDLTHEIYAGIGLCFESSVLFRDKKLSY
ncbi:MAG: toxin-antitoxin system YwqK family antitoxin [Bdellovibrionota bacterium]